MIFLIAFVRRIATIGLLVLVAIFILNGIFATIGNISTVKDSIRETSEKLARLESKEATLKNIGHDNLVRDSQKLTDAIPQTINLPVIVATLNKVAADTNVVLGDFSISSKSQALTIVSVGKAENLTNFQFRVNLTGNLGDTKQFISELGKVSPILGLEGLELSQEKSKLILNFYFQPHLASKTKIDETLRPLTDKHKKAISEAYTLTSPGIDELAVASSSGVSNRENPFR